MQTTPTYYRPETWQEFYDRICRNQQNRIMQAKDMDEYHALKKQHEAFKFGFAYTNLMAQAMEKAA